jgi:ribosomal-protein-serine acetyltransferase
MTIPNAGLTLKINERLSLQQLKPEMAAEIFALIDTNRDHLSEWLHWVDQIKTLEDTRRFVANSEARLASGGHTCAIIHNEKIVGIVSHHAIERERGRVDLGYWLSEAAEGQGLATAAVRALTNYTFRQMRLGEVRITTAVANVRSEGIPRRLGFRLSGRAVEVPASVWPGELNAFIMTAPEWLRLNSEDPL